jgi:ADP-dependent NAD(P)H-hydrate dehydratase / NAD(P)H-hydrate epimerase
MVAIVKGAMPGAAMLAARAAMRLSGYVVLAGGGSGGPDALVQRDWIDIASDAHVGALLIGPGLGRDADAQAAFEKALGSIHPLVLDADALRLLSAESVAQLGEREMPTILTPHAGEFAHLFGSLTGSKIDRARDAAAQTRTTIIFKGADTVIATPDGRVAISTEASGWLASAGTGDVLAGMVAGLLSGGMAPFEAAKAAVWLHGEAARSAGPALIADDLAHHLPAAIASCQ